MEHVRLRCGTIGPSNRRTTSGTTVFVTGRSFGPIGEGRDFATVAYSAIDGHELWVSRYDGPARGEEESNDEAYSIVVSPDGERMFVTGSSGGIRSDGDYATIAYNAADGTELWGTEVQRARKRSRFSAGTCGKYRWRQSVRDRL